MNKISRKEVLLFSKELAKKLYEMDRYILDNVIIRTSDIIIDLEMISQLIEAEKDGEVVLNALKKCLKYPEAWWKSNENIADFCSGFMKADEVVAIVFCEGELYETLYYHEAFGSREKQSKLIYKAFTDTVEQYGFYYEWDNGRIYLYSSEGEQA